MINGPKIIILELIARLNIGGPAVLVIDLAAGLPRDRYEVHLAAGRVGPGEAQMDFWAEARQIRWTPLAGLSPELGQGNLIGLREISRRIGQIRPAIVHTHTAKAGTLGRLAALSRWPRRPKLVHTFHGHVFHGYFSPAKTRMFLAIERFLARRTDRVVVLSQEQADDICRLYRVCGPERVAVIPLGLDLEPFVQARPSGLKAKMGLSPNTFLVGFAGRLTGIKDPFTLLRGLALAGQRATRPLALAIVGQGELEEAVKVEAARLGLANVHFLGWRPGIADIYPDFDLLALTSLNEGLPLVLVEALAAGRPVAATPAGGVPSLLNMGIHPYNDQFTLAERGLVFPVGSAEGLAQAINWAINHYDRALGLAEAGRRHVLANHGREGFIQAHAELYDALAGGRN